MTDELCNRCGACCHIKVGHTEKKCPQLSEKDGKPFCKIYQHRFGQVIATIHNTNYYCTPRQHSDNDYPNCPYNTNKPIMMPND